MKRLLQSGLISHRPDADQAGSSMMKQGGITMQVKMFSIILFMAMLPFTNVFSNNLTISNVTYVQSTLGAGTVTFDLSWENSWRSSLTLANNWDAAWVFVKFKDCTASANVQYSHGTISVNVGDHTFNGSPNTASFEPTLSDGSSVGIDASPNNTGVMLRNTATPVTGASVSARITLNVTNLPATGTTINVKVFGVEMVFVPQGTYYLGDGNATNKSYQSFAQGTSGAAASTAIQISSEAAQSVFESTQLIGYPSSQTLALTAPFPKGFGAFYLMKYEITQQAYVDFLNNASAITQSTHFPNITLGTNRHRIINASPGVFSTDRPYRACNFLSWSDFGAYLDWAALRPMTELEYEKACRGTALAVPFENAFSGTSATAAATFSGAENGTETITTANASVCANNITFSGGDGLTGPLRGGIFATGSTTTRGQTGSSYYGVMELSGNVDEYYISALAGVNNKPNATGVNLGDGMLDDATGHFNSNWPPPLAPSTYVIHRGRSWTTATLAGGSGAGTPYLNVSDRQGGFSATRDATSGGRGGRSVPSLTTTQTYTYTGLIDYFVVPSGVTSLTIEAFGAGGGISSSTNAGTGARMKGVCSVTPGEVLQILVGNNGSTARGAGGGTFVVRAPYNTLASALVVAGGGGGQGSTANTTTARNGQLSGGNGGVGYSGIAGGTGGNGAAGSTAGGGAGLIGNGGSSSYSGGNSFVNGGTAVGQGGFGGAGDSGSTTYGSGAGGYSGGGPGGSGGGGGGGGSIINGSVITNSQAGSAVGTPGQVILNW